MAVLSSIYIDYTASKYSTYRVQKLCVRKYRLQTGHVSSGDVKSVRFIYYERIFTVGRRIAHTVHVYLFIVYLII